MKIGSWVTCAVPGGAIADLGCNTAAKLGHGNSPYNFARHKNMTTLVSISGVQLSSSHVAHPDEKGNHALTIRNDILTSMPPVMQRFITIGSWMGASFSVSWIGSDHESHKVYVLVNPPYNWDFKLSAMKNMLHKHTLSYFPFRRSTCNPHDN